MARRTAPALAPQPVHLPLAPEEIEAYVRDLQGRLRLTDWTILINLTDPAKDDALADITPWTHQRRAELRLGSKFADLSPEDARQTLVHELLHCKLFALHDLVEEMLTEAAGAKAARLALVAINASIEQATDDLADVIAPHMPAWASPIALAG